MVNDSLKRWVVMSLFFGSGVTALVYEVVWSKYLSLIFGSTIQAQTVVLAVFMGGLALGNSLFGKISKNWDRPLRAYGLIELAIAFYALVFPVLFGWADHIFVAWGSPLLERGTLLLGLKGGLSVALLLCPTVLMGGTLPLLAAWLQAQTQDASRFSARFYSLNSLGAVCGAGLAGFWLVQNLGMVASLQITALANGLIGGLAYLLGKDPEEAPAPRQAADPVDVSDSTEPGGWVWASVLVALTGGISMGLEVLASRSLSLIFGSSLQSFAVVLMAFILGIGLGSAAMASSRWQPRTGWRVVAILLLAAACWIGLLVFKIEWWVELYRWSKTGLARSTVGYLYHQGLTAGMSMLLLGVPAALMGSVLPLLIRISTHRTEALGEKVGQLLTWNTLGAVVGVLVTGFVLMPAFGLRTTFAILALGLVILAGWTCWRRQREIWTAGSAGILVVLLALFLAGEEDWRHVISSGVFRARETEIDSTLMAKRKAHIKILFYEDAPDATVSVEQGDGQGAPDGLGLRINGKPDASSRSDLSTQLLLGHLPLLARPESQDVFILGLGSGITGGAVLGHPIQRLTIAENCEPVVRAAKLFSPWNHGVLTDERTRILFEDARTLLKLSPQKYDVIISQPSNPWMIGVGSVFSREFYELNARRLKPGGIVVQWFHLYEMHDGIVSMVINTFASVFPYVEIWDCDHGDIALLGSDQPWPDTLSYYRQGFERERPREDLARIGVHSVTALLARQLASQRTGFAIAEPWPVQSDFFPVLEYEAPRAFYLGISSEMLTAFDERTWQHDLSSPGKRAALNTLSRLEIRPVFQEFSSMNAELRQFLNWHLESRQPVGPEAEPKEIRTLPCVFRPGTEAIVLGSKTNGAYEAAQRLVEAAYLLEGDPAEERRGVAMVENLLLQPEPGTQQDRSWMVVRAVKMCLADSQTRQAARLVDLGLKMTPGDLQLRYLSRILGRELSQPWQVSRR